jgi:hypothetical protein
VDGEAATAKEQLSAMPGRRYSFGIDWGKNKDYTVIAVLDMMSREICNIERFNNTEYPEAIQRIARLVTKFSPSIIIPEQNSLGIPLVDFLRSKLPSSRILPFYASNDSKRDAFEAFRLGIETGKLKYISYPPLIRELKSFRFEQLESGKLKLHAASGEHDDTLVACALAYQALEGAEHKSRNWGTVVV